MVKTLISKQQFNEMKYRQWIVKILIEHSSYSDFKHVVLYY